MDNVLEDVDMTQTTTAPTAGTQYRIRSRATVADRGHDTPCWISDRTLTKNGYTKMSAGGVLDYTHRHAYRAFVGPIPGDRVIDHLCRVRACCNPQHLEAVSNRENLLRGDGIVAHESRQTHCLHGHEFTSANTYLRPDRPGRGCRTCIADSARRARRASRTSQGRARQG